MEASMKLGMMLRNYGPASTGATMAACAKRAEDAGIDQLWVGDHVAIPPDDAEGSGGRYVDPLATLAYLAGITERIGLGTGVLVLPHRRPLATAKWVASIQELSGGRLLFGVGVGGMEAEYRVTGVPWARRGAIADETLAFIHKCFAADEVEENGQRFLFLPRPSRPPILVGGAGPHALRRIVRYGDGWLAPRSDPAELRDPIATLQEAMAEAGRGPAEVVPMAALDLDDPPATVARVSALREVGATGLIYYGRYDDEASLAACFDGLATHVMPHLSP
jgi:probable F420-dependent oxidoreductase